KTDSTMLYTLIQKDFSGGANSNSSPAAIRGRGRPRGRPRGSRGGSTLAVAAGSDMYIWYPRMGPTHGSHPLPKGSGRRLNATASSTRHFAYRTYSRRLRTTTMSYEQ